MVEEEAAKMARKQAKIQEETARKAEDAERVRAGHVRVAGWGFGDGCCSAVVAVGVAAAVVVVLAAAAQPAEDTRCQHHAPFVALPSADPSITAHTTPQPLLCCQISSPSRSQRSAGR